MINKIKSVIRDYFGFSKTEMNGFFILFFLMVILLMAPTIFDKIYQVKKTVRAQGKNTALDSAISKLEAGIEKMEQKNVGDIQSGQQIKTIPPEDFDPNHASKGKLTQLGFKPWIAERIINYREKVGSFRYKEDLLKVYDLSKPTYSKLYNYIKLPEIPGAEEVKPKGNKPVEKKEIKTEIFDLNQADTTKFKEIYGIGSVLANRIVKYRYLIGGFTQKDQLKEVYGLKPEVIENLKQDTFIEDDYLPRQIPLNQVSVQKLAGHPYIDNNLAHVIINYREKQGILQEKEDLKKVPGINDSIFSKLIPYLILSAG